MKNTLWLYKDSYQIEIREKEAHPTSSNLPLQGRGGRQGQRYRKRTQ